MFKNGSRILFANSTKSSDVNNTIICYNNGKKYLLSNKFFFFVVAIFKLKNNEFTEKKNMQ